MLLSQTSPADIDAALTDANIRSLQIITRFVVASVGVFLLLVLAFTFNIIPLNASVQPGDSTRFMAFLSLTHAVIALFQYSLARFMISLRFGPKFLSRTAPDGPAAAEMWLDQMRSAHILRLAFFESAAFYGLLICLIGVMRGVMATAPIYWLNALSTLVLVIVAKTTFPHARAPKKRLRVKNSRMKKDDEPQIEELSAQLNRLPDVTQFDDGDEKQAHVVAEGLTHISESVEAFGDLFARLRSATLTTDQRLDVLWDIGEELRHMEHHIHDMEYFASQISDDEEDEGEKLDS